MRLPQPFPEPAPAATEMAEALDATVVGVPDIWLLSPAKRRKHSIRSMATAIAAATGVAGALMIFTWSEIGARVGLYLPPDGAHYIADAHALVGEGVRPLRHPPLFPALVAVYRPLAGDVTAFHLAMLTSLGLFALAMYVLARRWAGRGASLVGAAAATLMPTTAELLGWGGGATLLAAAGSVLSLAWLETWIRGRRTDALLVGGALGATALGHPFVFGVSLVCVGTRWLALVFERRRFGTGRDPLGLRGLGSVALPLAPAIVLVAPYYLSVEGGGSFSLRPPHPDGLADLLSWAYGTDPYPWLLIAVALAGIILFGERGLVITAGCICALAVVIATSVRVDQSYVTRIAYLIPVPTACGIAVGSKRLALLAKSRVRSPLRGRALLAGGAIVALSAVALVSYTPRLERAGTFYRFLEPADLEALRRLRGSHGVVATSWHGPEYGTGVSTSWFVEGLAHRPAFGPTAPWLSTVPEQRAVGQEMQRLFAGTEGIENGAIQVSSGPPGVRADPAVQVSSGGFSFPVLFGDSLVNGYPVAFAGDSDRAVVGDAIHWTFRDARGSPVLYQVARLDGRTVFLSYTLALGVPEGTWSLWFWPAYGVHWKDVHVRSSEVSARQGLPEEDVSFRIGVERGDVVYHALEERFGIESIEVRVEHATSVGVAISVGSGAKVGYVRSFDEEQILERYGISDVVVWKDTGWRDRFDRSDCYSLADETSGLLIYRTRACSGGLR